MGGPRCRGSVWSVEPNSHASWLLESRESHGVPSFPRTGYALLCEVLAKASHATTGEALVLSGTPMNRDRRRPTLEPTAFDWLADPGRSHTPPLPSASLTRESSYCVLLSPSLLLTQDRSPPLGSAADRRGSVALTADHPADRPLPGGTARTAAPWACPRYNRPVNGVVYAHRQHRPHPERYITVGNHLLPYVLSEIIRDPSLKNASAVDAARAPCQHATEPAPRIRQSVRIHP